MTRATVRTPARGGFLDSYFGRFWVSRAKLAVFRVVFFALVGLDGLRQIPHAPRYGAGDFNVGHFAWLEALLPAPTRAMMLVLFVWQAYLGFAIAFGAARRGALIALTAIYGYAYFVSQLDSYQHHYLVFLLLLCACFVPWQGAASTETAPSARTANTGDTVESWAVRLIIVQVAIVYLWAGITKLEDLWLDGALLDRQLQSGLTRDAAEWLGMSRAATLVMLAELFLFGALLWRRLWPYAVIVGCGLHAGIEFGAELKIGIFSYYMFAFYLLLLPDRWYRDGVRALAPRVHGLGDRRAPLASNTGLFYSLGALVLVLGSLTLALLPVEQANFLAISCALMAAALFAAELFGPGRRAAEGPDKARHARRRRALGVLVAHMLAGAAIALWPATVDEYVGDYYKFWGGSARRLQAWDEAEVAYRRLTVLRPGWAPGHYHLARIEEKNGDIEGALAGYERAQDADPDDYRAFLAAAVIHHGAGRAAEARAAAEHALARLSAMRPTGAVQRDTARARAMLDSLPAP